MSLLQERSPKRSGIQGVEECGSQSTHFSTLNPPYWRGPSGCGYIHWKPGIDVKEAICHLARRHEWHALNQLLPGVSPLGQFRDECARLLQAYPDLSWSGNRDLALPEFKALESRIVAFVKGETAEMPAKRGVA